MHRALATLQNTPFPAAYVALLGSVHDGIPKLLWVTMRTVPSPLPAHIAAIAARHPRWHLATVNDTHMDLFFDHVFANTSVHWAYHRLNPALGAAKADLFRYAVVYALGGVYFDADTDFPGSLDELLRPTDRFVWASERNGPLHCYNQQPLSPNERLGRYLSGGRYLQRLIVAAPEHPALGRTLTNAAFVLRALHLGHPVLSAAAAPPRGPAAAQVWCATGPGVFTASVRQVIFEQADEIRWGRRTTNGTHRRARRHRHPSHSDGRERDGNNDDGDDHGDDGVAAVESALRALGARHVGVDFSGLGAQWKMKVLPKGFQYDRGENYVVLMNGHGEPLLRAEDEKQTKRSST
jgi:mannosyltransferase OCH1-like enzyme